MTHKQRYARALRQLSRMTAFHQRIIINLIRDLAEVAPLKPIARTRKAARRKGGA